MITYSSFYYNRAIAGTLTMKYKAILFAPDGVFVIDARGQNSINEVWDIVADFGSRWFFYPIIFIITDHGSHPAKTQKIVDTSDAFIFLKGKRISTVEKWLLNNSDEAVAILQ